MEKPSFYSTACTAEKFMLIEAHQFWDIFSKENVIIYFSRITSVSKNHEQRYIKLIGGVFECVHAYYPAFGRHKSNKIKLSGMNGRK
jgi:hypothetical protein